MEQLYRVGTLLYLYLRQGSSTYCTYSTPHIPPGIGVGHGGTVGRYLHVYSLVANPDPQGIYSKKTVRCILSGGELNSTYICTSGPYLGEQLRHWCIH